MAVQSSPHRSTPLVCEEHARKLAFVEDMTKNTDSVQERVLTEILAQNGETEYLRRFELGGATDRETFKAKVPLVTYEDIQPDIRRIANGDRSAILSARPISELLTSSGTSGGEMKLLPMTEEEFDRRLLLTSLAMPVLSMYVPGLDKGKGLHFLLLKSESRSPGGLMMRTVITSFFKSDRYRHLPSVHTSPMATILCADRFQSMYTQMLCGLYARLEVLSIGSPFASSLLRAISFLQQHWQSLARDIETGILTDAVTDPSVRDSLAGILSPNPGLAKFIVDECSREDWAGIITRIWPNTKYLNAVVTGSMAQYVPNLEYYSGGSLPMVSSMYCSSECFFGLNLRPMCKPSEVSYTIMPNMAYFEFLPVDATYVDSMTAQPPKPVDLADVEVGREYEIVVTSYTGLYRYQVGDVLHVTGFHNSAPEFRFVRRKNAVLSIDTDKTNESELQGAVERASELIKPYGASVMEYTSKADTSVIPGHYVIYWELLVSRDPTLSDGPSKHVLEQCCLEMEEAMSSNYRMLRVADGAIGPLEIRVVKSGTFEELMEYAIARGTSVSQYKVPRCVSSVPIIELLDSRVESAHFSPAYPMWIPQTSR